MPMMLLVKNADGTFSEKPVRGSLDGQIEIMQERMAEQPYEDASYWYDCFAPIGSELTDPVWAICRTHKSTYRKQWANLGTANQLATDLATVAALIFT
jgi:hypothetical protein